MVSIHSAEENVFVAGLSSGPKLWLGGKRDCHDCDLYWTDGTPWDFQTWIPNNPSKDGNFVEMRVESEGKWNDRVGDLAGFDLPFVCKETTSSTTTTDTNTLGFVTAAGLHLLE